MKIRTINLVLAGFAIVAFAACNGGSTGMKSAKIESNQDSIAFAVGHSVGGNLAKQFPGISPEVLAQGIVAGYNADELTLYPNEQAADMAIRAYMNAERDRTALKNKEEGEAFLAENAKKEGIVVTESGLQYEVIAEGSGAKPTEESTVSVTYEGKTIDGSIFDSSIERGDTATFPLNGVIRGWTEGLQLMSVGSKYRFYIPSDLAYGINGAGGAIAPNSALIFDVELIDIQ